MLPGPGGILAIACAMLLRLSKIAALMGAMITNPWTAPFFYLLSFEVGVLVIRLEEPVMWRSVLALEENWQNELYRAAPPLLMGSVILGLGMASLCYVVVYAMVRKYREVRLEQLQS